MVMMPSKRLIASYTLDWIIIIAFAAAGGGLNYITTVGRPFSLLDLSVSYPLVPESVSIVTLALSCFLAPAVIIALVTLILVPGAPARRLLLRRDVVRRKLWELHAGLAGLCLSVALAFFLTQGLKNMFGKPRPHLLALCQPDLQNIASHVVGGYGQDISARWTLVSKSICLQSDTKALNDGFRSFPSGHSSWSWSGMLYLSLFLSSKLAIAIPYLPVSSQPTSNIDLPGLRMRGNTVRSNETELLPLHSDPQQSSRSPKDDTEQQPTRVATTIVRPVYNLAATPPNYGIVLVLIPLAVAMYITATRYFEYWHFGFDVIGGALIGIASAWLSFRWYHMPIRAGFGWAWGARSPDRAFAIGVGTAGYVRLEE